ncbi:MAG: hypothetical protein MJ245_00545 [Clostridia bacterium]|nr:hypothetical protein [Clostridia bacterium]
MKKEERLYLKVPTYDELWYRKQLLSDPKTMEFNKGYDIKDTTYNYSDGTYDFDETLWDNWYSEWGKNQKDKYYAYIVRKYDNKYIGEVQFNGNEEVNVLLEAGARGFHYSLDALNLLAKEAFVNRNMSSLSDKIPEQRFDQIELFKKAGYKKVGDYSTIKRFGMDEKLVIVSYSKEDYLINNQIKKNKLLSFFVKK